MSVNDVLVRCAMVGVKLTLSADGIRYRAPVGVLTPDLRAALTAIRNDLLDQFNERAAIREFSGNMDGAVAERLATADVLVMEARNE